MNLFNFFKKKTESTLDKALKEVERVGKEQPLKGVEALDKHFKKHPFKMNKVKDKKRRYEPVVCFNCGSKDIARYSYGMPILNEELKQKLESGEIILGGCCVMPNSPRYHCKKCGKDFGKAHL